MKSISVSQKVLIAERKIKEVRERERRIHYFLYAFLGFFAFWCMYAVIKNMDWERIGGLKSVVKAMGMFLPPDPETFAMLLKPTIETFMIATLGTGLAVVLALPVAWIGARNTTPWFPVTYPIGRAIMTISRSVHEIVWGLIFVTAVGLGAFPGILAVSMRSIGFVSKLTAEAIEDIDPKPVEAILAVGGNRFQVIFFGIFPQILPVFIGNAIFQWDINIRRASILGLVGAGGLGFMLHHQMVLYNYQGITSVILAMLLLVCAGEIVSYYTRKKIV